MDKTERQKRSWNDHEGPVLDSVDGFDVIECALCSFNHIVPIPSAQELTNIYKEDYYTKDKPLYIEKVKEDELWWEMVNSERFELFENYLDRSRRRILEVGSGPGLFLLKGKELGWQTLGFEPSTLAAEYSSKLGLDIINDFLTEDRIKDIGKFDVVYMHEVLEHIAEPLDLLRRANSLLDPGGLVSVVVPNDYNPFQTVLHSKMGFEPWWVAPPHHINYFTRETLSKLIESAGFKVLESETTFPIDIFLLMGENYIGDDEVGRRCHARRKSFEMNLERAGVSGLKRSIYKAFADEGIGREIVMLAQKP